MEIYSVLGDLPPWGIGDHWCIKHRLVIPRREGPDGICFKCWKGLPGLQELHTAVVPPKLAKVSPKAVDRVESLPATEVDPIPTDPQPGSPQLTLF